MRILTLCLGAAVLLAPAAAAQDVTVERDGDEVTITRPDGTVERFTVDADAELRVRSKDGPLVIENEDGSGGSLPGMRRFELRREGGPDGFAFRVGPEGAPFQFERFMDDFDIDIDADSLAERMLRFRRGLGGVDIDADREAFMPWAGFARRGVDPATRREIAEGERESRLLAQQIRTTEGAERERLERQLAEVLARTFDLKQEARRAQMEALREDIERLRKDLSDLEEETRARDGARDEVIERRQRELSGEGDALDW